MAKRANSTLSTFRETQMTFLLETMRLGLTNLRLHMLRSTLTALGIILGVAAVIAMVAIGEGSKREALEQLERLGATNIIVRSIKPPEESQVQGGQSTGWVSKYGITREDYAAIETNFPGAEALVAIKSVGGEILRNDLRITSQAFGVSPDLPAVAKLMVARGRYITQNDMDESALVAVIGHEVARALFPFDDPLGATMRIDDKVVRIVGVLRPVGLAGGAGGLLIGRDLNFDTHIPITTARSVFGDTVFRRESGTFSASEVQIQEVYLTSTRREYVLADADRLKLLMNSKHGSKRDIEYVIPYELLESARKSALTWNIVLGFIASISLIVGGIGIMNIMLASVTERTREIGIRRALGATRKHIIWQFLVETSVLSMIGGFIGIGIGVGGSMLAEFVVPLMHQAPFIGRFLSPDTQLPTQVTPWSIAVSFAVATITGLVFGLYPAMVAARQDPIVALRHD